jgi:hypothetical protein
MNIKKAIIAAINKYLTNIKNKPKAIRTDLSINIPNNTARNIFIYLKIFIS